MAILESLPNSLLRQTGGIIYFVDEKNYQIADVRANLINVTLSYTMNMASELTFSVSDVGLKMLENNYFPISRIVAYVSETFGTIEGTRLPDIKERQTQLFEIANVSVSQGPGASPTVEVRCYSRAVQQMKRDRKPGTIKGSGMEFVRQAALKYGLKFFGERTSKKQQINKASAGNKAESVWDVIQSLATEAKFVVFEVDGYLVFASEKFLLKRWGTHEAPIPQTKTKKKIDKKQNKYIPVIYKPHYQSSSVTPYGYAATIESPERRSLQLLSIPSMNISENNPWDGSGNAILDRYNAVRLRPGMTIKLEGVPTFNGYYLIDSVTFSDLSPDPVNISFKKPEKQPKEIKDLPIGKRGPQVIDVLANTSAMPGQVFKRDDIARFFKPPANLKIFPLPTAENPNNYPPATAGVFSTGNINLYDRPILIVDGEPRTLYSSTHIVSELGVNRNRRYALILPQIVTPSYSGVQKQLGRASIIGATFSHTSVGVYALNLQITGDANSDGIMEYFDGDVIELFPSGYSSSDKKLKSVSGLIIESRNVMDSMMTIIVRNKQQIDAVRAIAPKLIGGFIESSNPAYRYYEGMGGGYLARVRGATINEAIKNASIYAKLLSEQQRAILQQKFPRGNITEMPGAS